MTTAGWDQVREALGEVIRDHGWALSGEPARLRAALSDVLGAAADEHRGAVDAIVLAAEEGVPGQLSERGSGEAVTSSLTEALVSWGLSKTQAGLAIAAWADSAPPPAEVTAPPPDEVAETQLPPPPAPDDEPEPATELPPTTMPPADETAPEPEPAPERSPGQSPTVLPPVATGVGAATALPASGGQPEETDDADLTQLPPTAEPGGDVTEMSSPVVTDDVGAGGAPAPPGQMTSAPPGYSEPGDEAPAEPAVAGDMIVERRGRRGLLVAGVVAAAVVIGGTIAAVAVGGSADDEPTAGPTAAETPVATETSEAAGAEPLVAGELLTANVSPDPVEAEVAMASRTAGVRLTGVSEIESVTVGGEDRIAPEGASLLAFTLAGFPCDGRCIDWTKAGLRVDVDGAMAQLESPARGHVVVVPDGAKRIDVVLRRDGRTQRLSLLDAAARTGNLVVLSRRDRVASVDETLTVSESLSRSFTFPNGGEYSRIDRQVTVGDASLHFWVRDGGKLLDAGRPARAFVVVDVHYSLAAYGLTGERYFQRSEISLRLPDGTTVRPQNDRARPLRFAVPGDVERADLLIGGRGFFSDGAGTPYTADVSSATVRITWP